MKNVKCLKVCHFRARLYVHYHNSIWWMTVAHAEIVQTCINGDVMMDIASIKENIVMEYQIARMAVTRNQVRSTFWFCIHSDCYFYLKIHFWMEQKLANVSNRLLQSLYFYKKMLSYKMYLPNAFVLNMSFQKEFLWVYYALRDKK